MTADLPEQNQDKSSLARNIEANEAAIRHTVDRVWNRLQPPAVSAEDLFQATVLELLQSDYMRDEPSNLLGLVWTIASRRAIDNVRKHRPQGLSAGSESEANESHVFDDRLQGAVRVALESLDPSDRDLLAMRFRSEMLLRDIAQARGMTIQSVATAIERSLEKLKKKLREMSKFDVALRDELDQSWPS